MKYTSYKLFSDHVKKISIKARSVSKKEAEKKPYSYWIDTVFQNAGMDFVFSMDLHSMMAEKLWLEGDRISIYIDSSTTVEMLQQSKFTIQNPEKITTPDRVFIVNFPKGTEVNGTELESVLVTFQTVNEKKEKIIEQFSKYNMPKSFVTIPKGGEGKKNFCAYFVLKEQIDKTAPEKNHQAPTYYMELNLDEMGEHLAAHDFEHYMEKYNLISDRKKLPYNADLTSNEQKFNFELGRILLGTCLYIQARPESLKDGLPGEYIVNAQGTGKVKVNKSLLTSATSEKEAHASPDSHYRSWHFRQLTHERYYRGEFSDMEPGTRIVFVSDSLVNRDEKSKTFVRQD